MHRTIALRLALLLVVAAPAFAQQDTWTGVERIVAVGDVHGDCDQFVKVLRAAQVVNEKNDWVAGKTHLVQIGDVLDRGPDSRKAMDLLMKLQDQAAKVGGVVHPLIGNHEAMVLLGDWRYVHPGEVKAFGGVEEFRKAMSAEGKYGRWIRTHNTAIKINDLLFVHAGITPLLARLSLEEMNNAIREELRKADASGMANSAVGPLWDRTLALDDEEEVARQLDTVLKKYGARRMVIGHSVSAEGVAARAGGRLIRIDVGLADLYGGPASCLVVEKGMFYVVTHPKAKRKLSLDEAVRQPAAASASESRRPLPPPRRRVTGGGVAGASPAARQQGPHDLRVHQGGGDRQCAGSC